jgi:hypothetical protein
MSTDIFSDNDNNLKVEDNDIVLVSRNDVDIWALRNNLNMKKQELLEHSTSIVEINSMILSMCAANNLNPTAISAVMDNGKLTIKLNVEEETKNV